MKLGKSKAGARIAFTSIIDSEGNRLRIPPEWSLVMRREGFFLISRSRQLEFPLKETYADGEMHLSPAALDLARRKMEMTQGQRELARVSEMQRSHLWSVRRGQDVFYINPNSTVMPVRPLQCPITGCRFRIRPKKKVRVLMTTFTMKSRSGDHDHFLGRFYNIEEEQ